MKAPAPYRTPGASDLRLTSPPGPGYARVLVGAVMASRFRILYLHKASHRHRTLSAARLLRVEAPRRVFGDT